VRAARQVRTSIVEHRDGVFPRSYRRKALILLLLIYIFNFVDRQVVNILAESIKHDLSLTDTQLGMTTGLAFAIFYSLLGLPIARYAEYGDRPRIIAVTVAIWSSFTALCGFATSFLHMFLSRVGVGIGEAGGVPPAHSLIVEFTPREERASALAFYSMGMPLGALFGLGLGGIIADMFGWRTAFFAAGLPGLIFAALALSVLREPRRRVGAATAGRDSPSLRQALVILAAKPTYRWLLVGATFQSMVSYGVGSFMPPYFFRMHAAELADLSAAVGLKPIGYLGIWLGFATGLGGAVGAFTGGRLADRFGRSDLRAYPAVAACGSLLAIPLYLIVFSTPSALIALLLLFIPSACHAAWYGPLHASNQGLVHPQMRATISAVTLVVINLIGLGLGPPLVGVLSDRIRRSFEMDDAGGLQAALLATILLATIAVFGFWRARRTIVADTVS
jgi:MFS family permease